MGLWDSVTDWAEDRWKSFRTGVSALEDLYSSHVLGEQTTYARDYGIAIGELPSAAADKDMSWLVETAAQETPLLRDALNTADEGKRQLQNLAPPGPPWLWLVGGVFVLGAGAVVAWKVLR